MSFGIIFEVFGEKKLEMCLLLAWYVIVWTFVRTRCSSRVSRNNLLIDLFILVHVQYCHSTYSGEAWMLKVRWCRFILRVSNHTNIFRLERGFQVSVYKWRIASVCPKHHLFQFRKNDLQRKLFLNQLNWNW